MLGICMVEKASPETAYFAASPETANSTPAANKLGFNLLIIHFLP
ncbi:hypothetical protein [Thermomonas brevis]|nr:hypothetical protein [Thermomonas brevis]